MPATPNTPASATLRSLRSCMTAHAPGAIWFGRQRDAGGRLAARTPTGQATHNGPAEPRKPAVLRPEPESAPKGRVPPPRPSMKNRLIDAPPDPASEQASVSPFATPGTGDQSESQGSKRRRCEYCLLYTSD